MRWLRCIPPIVLVSLAACSVDGIEQVFSEQPPSSSDDGGAPGSGGAGAGNNGGSPNVTTTLNGMTNSMAAPENTVTTATSTSTGSGPADITVYCDNQPCEAGQVCCYWQFAAGKDFCAAPGGCPNEEGWVQFSCNGSDDCNGGECCGVYSENFGWGTIACDNQCTGEQIELCFDDPFTCEDSVCTPSGSLGAGYSYCGTG